MPDFSIFFNLNEEKDSKDSVYSQKEDKRSSEDNGVKVTTTLKKFKTEFKVKNNRSDTVKFEIDVDGKNIKSDVKEKVTLGPGDSKNLGDLQVKDKEKKWRWKYKWEFRSV